MKLQDIKVVYTHPALRNDISADGEYQITKDKDDFVVNKINFTLEEIKSFFAPLECKWDDVEFTEKETKKNNK